MGHSSLLLAPERREQIIAFFEPRAEAIDACSADIRDGHAFLHEGVLAGACDRDGHPNADLLCVAQTIATVAWSDMSSAFSLWCHRMVLEYLSWAPAGSVLRTEVLPDMLRARLIGSTALAAAVAHLLGQAPLPVVARRDGDDLVLNGRINWASNLFTPDFLMVSAVADADGGPPSIVAIPASASGVTVNPYPRLLALQSTASSSLVLQDVRIGPEWTISNDFNAFVRSTRPIFLLLQSSFCAGLTHRALAEARGAIRSSAEVFRGDLEVLEERAARLADRIHAEVLTRAAETPIRDIVQLRLDAAQLAMAAVALEAKVMGGRGYVVSCPTARRFREAAFLPIQTPTEGQLRWELSHSA